MANFVRNELCKTGCGIQIFEKNKFHGWEKEKIQFHIDTFTRCLFLTPENGLKCGGEQTSVSMELFQNRCVNLGFFQTEWIKTHLGLLKRNKTRERAKKLKPTITKRTYVPDVKYPLSFRRDSCSLPTVYVHFHILIRIRTSVAKLYARRWRIYFLSRTTTVVEFLTVLEPR